MNEDESKINESGNCIIQQKGNFSPFEFVSNSTFMKMSRNKKSEPYLAKANDDNSPNLSDF